MTVTKEQVPGDAVGATDTVRVHRTNPKQGRWSTLCNLPGPTKSELPSSPASCSRLEKLGVGVK